MDWTQGEEQEFIEDAAEEEDQEDYRKISANKINATPKRVRRNIAKIEEEVKVNVEANSDFMGAFRGGEWLVAEQEQVKGNTMGGPFEQPGLGETSELDSKQMHEVVNEEVSQRSLKFSERSEMLSKKTDSGSSKQSTLGQTREVFKL